MATTYIIKVYADAVEAGKRTFKSIPEKSQVLVYEELENRVKAGTLSEKRLNELIQSN